MVLFNSKRLQALYQPSGWYVDAARCVQAMGQATGTEPATVATIVAALSPQVSVTRNIYASLCLLAGAEPEDRPAGILGASWRKACENRASGPKVTAFRSNLLGDFSQVTMDVWAWRALGVAEAPWAGSPLWERGQACYRRAAHALGVEPAECQAGVWCSIRTSADYRFVTNPYVSGILQALANRVPAQGRLSFMESVFNREAETVAELARKVLALL